MFSGIAVSEEYQGRIRRVSEPYQKSPRAVSEEYQSRIRRVSDLKNEFNWGLPSRDFSFQHFQFQCCFLNFWPWSGQLTNFEFENCGLPNLDFSIQYFQLQFSVLNYWPWSPAHKL